MDIVAGATVLLALTVGLAQPVEAATRFVATTGSNTANTCLSSSAPCKTITHALTQAVANDTISVAAGIYNLALGETFPLIIDTDLTFTGAGAGSTILDATGANQRVITIAAGPVTITVTITGVTTTGGHVNCTSSFSMPCLIAGGGIGVDLPFNTPIQLPTLTLANSTVSGNTLSCITGNGECRALGGGLRAVGTVTLANVTVSGNTINCTASFGACILMRGGGLDVVGFGGPATLTNVTVSGNTINCTASFGACTPVSGGGLSVGGNVTLTNVTVSGNTGGGIHVLDLDNTLPTTLSNTIIATQLTGPDCSGFSIISLGHNLSSDATCGFSGPGDLNNTNPLLGPLQNNGGPTQTHALLPGSPAINAGTNSDCPSADQRGITRPQGGTCDIGAFEFGVLIAALELTGTAFHTDQQITYQATMNPGVTPAQVDIYLGVLMPDGVTFLSFVPGPGETIAFTFGPAPVPFATKVTPTPAVKSFTYTFTGAEPVGTYYTYAGLAVPDSNPLQPENQLSVAVQAFQFTP